MAMAKENNKKRLLIIDDDIGSRESLEQLFLCEYEVFVCKTYSEAIEAIQKTAFDIAIIDIRLEHINTYNVEGLGILQKLNEERPETITVVLTGYRDDFRDEIINKFSPDLLIGKGRQFDSQEFKETIRELLDEERSRD